MQSEIRIYRRASPAVLSASDVPLPTHPPQRLLCLAQEPAEQTSSGRRAPDRADPADAQPPVEQHLDVDMRRAAGIGNRYDGAEVEASGAVGIGATKALEAIVARGAPAVVGVQINE